MLTIMNMFVVDNECVIIQTLTKPIKTKSISNSPARNFVVNYESNPFQDNFCRLTII